MTRTSPPLPSAPQKQESKFPLGPGDELKVTVWGYPELSEQVVILPDGTISYPLIGMVAASGLSARDLAKAIGQALESHIESPQVSVLVAAMRSRRFSVMGAVERAGTYPLWSDDVSVLEAIAQAGGMNSAALPADVKIFRMGAGGVNQPMHVDVTAVLDEETSAETVRLKSGDVVYVPSQTSRRGVCVLGQVQAPGLYTLKPNMTVIEALSAAGWAKPSGVLRSVMVVRRGQQGAKEFFRIDARRAITRQDWSQHLVLQPGDVVYVPENFVSKVGDFVSFFSSKVEPAASAYLRVYDASNPTNFLANR